MLKSDLNLYDNVTHLRSLRHALCHIFVTLLPTGSEEREVLGVRSIPVAILPSCHDMKTIAL